MQPDKIVEQMVDDKTLIKYVRKTPTKIVDGKKQKAPPVGVLVGKRVTDETGKVQAVHIGWSRCHRRDKFDRKVGLAIALLRMQKNCFSNIPPAMEEELEHFKGRCQAYYRLPVEEPMKR